MPFEAMKSKKLEEIINNRSFNFSSIGNKNSFLIGTEYQQSCKPDGIFGETDIRKFDDEMLNIPKCEIYKLENIYLAGQGVLIDEDGSILFSESIHMDDIRLQRGGINPILFKKIDNKYYFNKDLKTKIITDLCVPISRPGEAVYGHWLVDILPRVVISQMMGIKAKYISTVHIPEYARKLLELLGVRKEDIITYEPMKEILFLKNSIIPSYLRTFKSGFSPMLIELNRRFLSLNINKTKKFDKIYISRGDYNDKQQFINEKEIIRIVQKEGFQIIEPHLFSIEEQISLFSNATQVIGAFGSSMHNTIFSKAGTKIIVLQSDLTHVFVQAGMGKALGHPTSFVIGKNVANDNNSVDKTRSFYIEPNDLKEAISLFLKE